MNCPACGLNIDEHPANRCLDAWVAEAVFERQVKYVPPEELPPAGKIDGVPILRKHGVWLLDDYDPEQDGVTVSLWDVPASHVSHYSTDIVAAWEIVRYLSNRAIEIVVAEGFSGNLSACMMYEGTATPYPPRDAFLHLATIEQASNDFGYLCVRAQAKAVPLAICKAALLAILQE